MKQFTKEVSHVSDDDDDLGSGSIRDKETGLMTQSKEHGRELTFTTRTKGWDLTVLENNSLSWGEFWVHADGKLEAEYQKTKELFSWESIWDPKYKQWWAS